jgi:hypothetical protein
MSNYTVTPKNPDHTVMVGWDAPLNTFFAHVIDEIKNEDEKGRDVYWVGCRPNEILDLQTLLTGIQPYVVLTTTAYSDLVHKLERDAN